MSRAQTGAFTTVDLGVTPGSAYSGANGINNLGQTVGFVATNSAKPVHAALFTVNSDSSVNVSDFGLFGFDAIGANASSATAINNAGQIIGSIFNTTNSAGQNVTNYINTGFSFPNAIAFLADGSIGAVMAANYPPIAGAPNGNPVFKAINDSGEIVGSSSFVNGFGLYPEPAGYQLQETSNALITTPAFVRDLSGQPYYFNGDPYDETAVAINSSGQVMMDDAVTLYNNDTNTLAYYGGTVATDINDNGLAAGSVLADYISFGPLGGVEYLHAATFVPGSTNDLGALISGPNNGFNNPKDVNSVALGINIGGYVVGTSDDTNSAGTYFTEPFFYSPAGGMVDLLSLLPAGSPWTGFTFGSGKCINDWNQIVGQGTQTNGTTHALLLNPTRPPVTTGLTLVTAWLLGGMNYNLVPALTDTQAHSMDTIASFRDGTANNDGDTNANRRLFTARFTSNTTRRPPLVSDALAVGGTGGDTYVIQLSFFATNAAPIFGSNTNARLCSFKRSSWAHNAVDDNIGGQPNFVGYRAYNASTDFYPGTYGITTNRNPNTAWAVVNHTGTFGVAMDPVKLKTIRSFTHLGTISTLKISSYTGYPYQFERTTSLASGFSVVQTNAGATGTILTYSTNELSAGQAFYQVQLGP
ncbi:MAG TPA: hypothetical protein VH251_08845 [Verrucomicrobiae bacterium]|nr:hypothetical protein [Verrucomicrobiae bacterium]